MRRRNLFYPLLPFLLHRHPDLADVIRHQFAPSTIQRLEDAVWDPVSNRLVSANDRVMDELIDDDPAYLLGDAAVDTHLAHFHHHPMALAIPMEIVEGNATVSTFGGSADASDQGGFPNPEGAARQVVDPSLPPIHLATTTAGGILHVTPTTQPRPGRQYHQEAPSISHESLTTMDTRMSDLESAVSGLNGKMSTMNEMVTQLNSNMKAMLEAFNSNTLGQPLQSTAAAQSPTAACIDSNPSLLTFGTDQPTSVPPSSGSTHAGGGH